MDKKEIIDISSSVIDNPTEDKYNDYEHNGKDVNYWRSFRELYNDPDFHRAQKKEFDKEAGADFSLNKFSGVSRRKFLALMGASAALAAAGCGNYRDKGELISYNKQPDYISIGNPNFFASTCTACGDGCGILVRTREGRPIKIDGNPDHPVSKGKTCAKAQASILNLYEPDRLKDPQFSSNRSDWANISWQEADKKIIDALKSAASSGKEIAIVTHSINSPTFKKVLTDFTAAYPTAKVYSYEFNSGTNRDSAYTKAYGGKAFPSVRLNEAKIIVSLECDFLGNDGNKVANSRMFAEGRDILSGKDFNRLYSVEGDVSLTGLNADYRMRLRTDAMEEFAIALLNELGKKGLGSFAVDSAVSSSIGSASLADFVKKHNIDAKAVEHLVEDLSSNRGSSIIMAGSSLPESTHIIVQYINEALGNSKLYDNNLDEANYTPLSTRQEIESLVNGINNGSVGVVIHADTNPVFHFASAYNYAEIIKKVPTVITMTEIVSDTSAVGNYILPLNHMLESWGDYRKYNNFYSFQQPVITPLYRTRQKEAMLLTWAKQDPAAFNEMLYHNYLIENWKTIHPALGSAASFNDFWNKGLHDGVVITTAAPVTAPVFNQQPMRDALSKAMKPGNDFVLLLKPSGNLGDGRFANNGWLQELPNAITKVVWDNYAAISVDSAKALNVDTNDLIEIEVEGRKVELPVFVQPGMADNVISVETGYGRQVAGTVGSDVGVNVNVLRSASPGISDNIYHIKPVKAGGSYELVTTQEHYPIDQDRYKDIHYKRHIIREGTFLAYKSDPKLFKHEEEEEEKLRNFPSINDEHKYTGVKWGMAIDLNKCLGCGECTIACNVENNIPVVGKDQVKVNREMHWLRTDRYYSGTPQNVRANFQPMLCQHCDFAPCENVCPVAATTHSTDGINGMAYNRCVGTRYCSNNCPYKVRRFNYFNFRDRFEDAHYLEQPVNLMHNPEVTVRARGVMEKCTFCVQRVMHARQTATQEKRPLKGTDVTTACQDACSTNAIYFGDSNDKNSPLQKYIEHDISYYVLNEIKTRPNITYMAKLRNTYENVLHVTDEQEANTH